MDDYYLIGVRIQELRSKKYTQKELADLLNEQWKSVSRVESNGTLSIKTLKKYAEALDTAPQFLLPFSWLTAHHKQQHVVDHLFYLIAQVQDKEFLCQIQQMIEDHLSQNKTFP